MNFRASIDTGLPLFPPNKLDTELQRELVKVYNAFRNLQIGIDMLHRSPGIYAVDVSYGKLVAMYNSSGTYVKLATASATGPVPAIGFCPTPEGIISGKPGEVQYLGLIEKVSSGLVPGDFLYLSATSPGTFTPVAPIGVGQIVQPIGFAVSTTDIYFNPSLTYTTV